jgi:hypothetical protein
MYIDINLAMIAGYRGMLGIDDRKMEEEQGRSQTRDDVG